MKEEEALDLGM